MDIQNPILIGHSDGGTIALIYAAYYPTTALITEAAHIYIEEVTLEGIQKAKDLYLNTDLQSRLHKYHKDKTDSLFAAWADTWLSPQFRDWNIELLLGQVKVPALIIQGEQDEYASVGHLKAIVQSIGSTARSMHVPNCGHNPHKEKPEMILAAMHSFIMEHS